jgi:hypothetical protein
MLCLVGTACGMTPPIAKVLFEGPRGKVFLQPIPDRSFQVSHPVHLETALIARVLSGVLVQERERALQAVLAGSSSTTPIFSAEEIQFLAPLLARALATATTDQAVGFLVTSTRPGDTRLEYSTTETTVGSLYAYDLSLYFLLSQYRYAPARTTTENIAHRRLPDTSGLSDRTLLFTPSFAQRSGNFHRPAAETSADKFLAIDYQLLQQVSPSAGSPGRAEPRTERTAEPHREDVSILPPSQNPLNVQRTLSSDQEIHALKDLVIQKDMELETLRKELQSIRKQLDAQTTRQDSQKRKNKSPSKLPQTVP